MAGVYRPRHPERTVLCRVLFHSFDRFLAEYESGFEKEYGYFRPIIKEIVESYLDCGNPKCDIDLPGCQLVGIEENGERSGASPKTKFLHFYISIPLRQIHCFHFAIN